VEGRERASYATINAAAPCFSSCGELAVAIGWDNDRTPNRPFQAKFNKQLAAINGVRLRETGQRQNPGFAARVGSRE